MKLSLAARSAVRSAISKHDGWNTYRVLNNLTTSGMSADQMRDAARALSIDVLAIADAANAKFESNRNRTASTVFGDAAMEEAKQEAASTSDGFGRATVATDDKANDQETARRAFDRKHYENGGQDFNSQAFKAAQERRAAEQAVYDDAARTAHTETMTVNVNADHAKAAHTANDTDKFAKLSRMLADLMTAPTVDEETVKRIVLEQIEATGCTATGSIAKVQLVNVDGATHKTMEGTFHPSFPELLQMAQGRKSNGQRLSFWLTGPAGSGKTTAVKQVAAALDMPFHYNGSIGMSHELFGFIDATGCYHRTAFREAYEHGGVYLFDEVDGSDANALLTANGPLAGTTATFPDGAVERHPDCMIFATANTWGLGGNADYVGRTKLDGAFVDRFDIKFDWGYDEAFEIALATDTAFALRVQEARRAAMANGVKVLITPRATIAGCALLAIGLTSDQAANRTYRANLSEAQRAMIP